MRPLRTILALCSALLPIGCASLPRATPATGADIVIRNVSVLDVERGSIVRDQDVTIRGSRIVSVAESSARRAPNGSVIDGSGKFVIPGLWDMHAHLSFSADRAKAELPIFLAHGVTGLRVMGADRPTATPDVTAGLDQNRAFQARIEAREQVGPHLLAMGSWPVDGPTGIGDAMPVFYKATTREDGRELARYFKTHGFDFVKIYNDLSREGFLGLAAEARTLGLFLAGHEPRTVSAIDLSDAGQGSIEHSRIFLLNCFGGADSLRKRLLPDGRSTAMLRRMVDEYDGRLCAPVFRAFVRNHTYITPTHVTRRMEAFAHDSAFTSDARMKYIPFGQRMAWLSDARTVGASLRWS